MNIDGSIMLPVSCILEKNLPEKIIGNQWYITVKNKNDTVGKLWVPNTDGLPVCMCDSPVIDLIKDQINVLEDSPNFTGSPKIQGQQIAVKDTIVEIWSGNIVNGTITLSEKITNFNRIDLHTQPAGGYGYTAYSFDRGQHGWKLQTNTKYAIPIATGKGLDIVFSDDGMSATVSNNTGILRRIFAFKKG